MEVISSENYLGDSQLVEENLQSLYADEQPKKKRVKKRKHSKLAETVSIENNVMLNAEDLAKATARTGSTNKSGKDPGQEQSDSGNIPGQSRQTRSYTYGAARRKGVGNKRHAYEIQNSPGSDIKPGVAAATETRTSVIHGLPVNRKRKPASSDSESEEASLGDKEDVEKASCVHLRCYEQFEKDHAGDDLSGRGNNYIQNSNVESSRTLSTQADSAFTQARISENFPRASTISGGRVYPAAAAMVNSRAYSETAINTKSTKYMQPQHVHGLNAYYRVQVPPEFPMSQNDQRGKQLYDRGGLAPSSSGTTFVPQEYAVNFSARGKRAFADRVSVKAPADFPNTYGGYSVYETRSPASSTGSNRERELPSEQEQKRERVQHFHSPVVSSKEESGQPSPKSDSLDRGVGIQGKTVDESSDIRQLDGNRNIKGKRHPGGKLDTTNQCGQCGKTFASSSALAKHRLTHSDERKFVCEICGKGFKRPDHLKGHEKTHCDKKPYQCGYSDCDKSYCDMRSLKRHYENSHPLNSEGMQSMPSTARSCKSDGERGQYKVIQQHEECFAPDMEENQCSPQPLQETTYCDKSKQEVPLAGVGRKRNSDSMCSNSSEDLSRIQESHSSHQPHVQYDKQITAVGMLRQVVDHSQERKGEKQVPEGYPQPGFYTYPEGYKQQWYPYQPQMIPVYPFNGNQGPMLFSQSVGPYGPTRTSTYPTSDPPQIVPSYPPANSSQSSRGNEKNSNVNSWTRVMTGDKEEYCGMIVRSSGAPTDPTSVAIVNAVDNSKQRQYKEGQQNLSPVVQWKTVPVNKEKSGMPPFSMGNNPVAMQYPSVNPGVTSPDQKVKTEQIKTALNISIPSSQADKRCAEMAGMDDVQMVKRHCPQSLHSKATEEPLLKLGDENIKARVSTKNTQDVFRNPPSTPHRKPRPKPDPIHIPCSMSTGFPVSPPIYTPPPMLSPRSIFHISSATLTPRGGTTPLTPGRFFLGNRSRKNSVDGDQQIDQQDIIIPDPKINIGPQFQAEIPSGMAPRSEADFDKHRVSVCWIPFERETRKRSQEIEAFLDMACSVAVHGGGSNKEYALHVLYRLKGNIKQAVRHILANRSAIQKQDGLADYHYEGSEKWSKKEKLKFREVLGVKGKDFFQISKEIGTKTVAQCVEFYYLWKATHPEAMRSRTRYGDTESESENVHSLSENEDDSTLVFECDFPECHSKFISRQALNGHIRVHGGSFMKPSEPRRTKIKTTISSDPGSSNTTSTTTAVSRSETKPAKPAPSTSSSTVVPNGDGSLPEFACKVCGRIFHKIKSRSAHMKTHVKRSDDDHIGTSN